MGIDKTTTDEDEVGSDGPEEGPSMGEGGAMPTGSEQDWETSMAHPDSTDSGPVTGTGTVSHPMPGEKNHSQRSKDAKINSSD